MRVLVSGDRNFTDTELLYSVLDDLAKVEVIDVIIEGDARGADRMAGYWARKNRVDLLLFPADWNTFGKSAGYIRNKQMLVEGKPDLVIAFLAPDSKGTKNMIEQAREAGVEVRIINV